MEIVEDQTDRELFFSSTVVVVGNGRFTPFWDASWCNGQAPKNIAPALYRASRFKKRSVHQELQNHNWIRNIKSMNNMDVISDFIKLESYLQQVQLSDEEDRIIWRWTGAGDYTARSAYAIQFSPFVKQNWTTKFNIFCSLCNNQSETMLHLLQRCHFTRTVWAILLARLQLNHLSNTIEENDLKDWLIKISKASDKKLSRGLCGMLLFFWWGVWKEQNQRIFQGAAKDPTLVANSIVEEIRLFELAMSCEL